MNLRSNIAVMFKFTSPIMSAADLQEQVEQLKRGLGKPVQGPPDDFGQRLKEATRRRVAPFRGNRIQAHVKAEDETFADKLRKAVQLHPKSKEQAGKNADKDRARYHKPQQRKPTKSD